MINTVLIERLRELREDSDLTQKQIVAILNCTQVSYSHYEAGRRDVPSVYLITLANHYGVSVDYLLGLTDTKERYPAPGEEK